MMDNHQNTTILNGDLLEAVGLCGMHIMAGPAHSVGDNDRLLEHYRTLEEAQLLEVIRGWRISTTVLQIVQTLEGTFGVFRASEDEEAVHFATATYELQDFLAHVHDALEVGTEMELPNVRFLKKDKRKVLLRQFERSDIAVDLVANSHEDIALSHAATLLDVDAPTARGLINAAGLLQKLDGEEFVRNEDLINLLLGICERRKKIHNAVTASPL